MSSSKAIILALYWKLRGYVDNYRVDRFIRWLSERGDEVVVVRGAGTPYASGSSADRQSAHGCRDYVARWDASSWFPGSYADFVRNHGSFSLHVD